LALYARHDLDGAVAMFDVSASFVLETIKSTTSRAAMYPETSTARIVSF
jgi:hypothetical protein